MTNREYMINLLLDGLESRLNRVSIDDGGASEEAMIYYNINCPCKSGSIHWKEWQRDDSRRKENKKSRVPALRA